jgi:hypothetical protein
VYHGIEPDITPINSAAHGSTIPAMYQLPRHVSYFYHRV